MYYVLSLSREIVFLSQCLCLMSSHRSGKSFSFHGRKDRMIQWMKEFVLKWNCLIPKYVTVFALHFDWKWKMTVINRANFGIWVSGDFSAHLSSLSRPSPTFHIDYISHWLNFCSVSNIISFLTSSLYENEKRIQLEYSYLRLQKGGETVKRKKRAQMKRKALPVNFSWDFFLPSSRFSISSLLVFLSSHLWSLECHGLFFFEILHVDV